MHISEMEQKFQAYSYQFKQVCETLEKHYRDMQDMEFTESMVNCICFRHVMVRELHRLLLRSLCDLVDEGMRTEEEAVAPSDPRNL